VILKHLMRRKKIALFKSWDEAYQHVGKHTHLSSVEVEESIKSLRQSRFVDVQKRSSKGTIMVGFVADKKHIKSAIEQEKSKQSPKRIDVSYPVNPHTSTRH
jgi:hypothetical protein